VQAVAILYEVWSSYGLERIQHKLGGEIVKNPSFVAYGNWWLKETARIPSKYLQYLKHGFSVCFLCCFETG
jgi:hypothetical protein